MKKSMLFLLCSFISLYCIAQETKPVKQTEVTDKAMVLVPLRGVRSGGVRGCDNCNISGKLAQRINLVSFTVDSMASFRYNEKLNTLEVKYLISNVVGKIKTGGTTVSGPYGRKVRDGNTFKCSQYGFGCQPPPYRIGKTKYEVKTEGKKNFLVVTFLEDLKVEEGFFGG
jgi:hypothetical protein